MTITPSPPILAPRPSSEDCLLLNIWVPARPPPVNGFPVLFFIHGGWLQVGNPHHDTTKDPSDLIAPVDEGGAGLQAIVVSPGYRLGIFGFLAMADMPEGERGNL
jgi:carboxylesterase type B